VHFTYRCSVSHTFNARSKSAGNEIYLSRGLVRAGLHVDGMNCYSNLIVKEEGIVSGGMFASTTLKHLLSTPIIISHFQTNQPGYQAEYNTAGVQVT
jgi:hypothetical protein